MPKDGRSHGNQTYRWGDCKYRCTPDSNRRYYPEKTIQQALDCYEEGMSVSAIARAMEINCAAVYGWIKKGELYRKLPMSFDRGGSHGAI